MTESSPNPFEPTEVVADDVPWERLFRLWAPVLGMVVAALVFATCRTVLRPLRVPDPWLWMVWVPPLGGLLVSVGVALLWRHPWNRVFWLPTASLLTPVLLFSPVDAFNAVWNAVPAAILGYLTIATVVGPRVPLALRPLLGFVAVNTVYNVASVVFACSVLPYPFYWVATGLLLPIAALHPDEAVVPAALVAIVRHPAPFLAALVLAAATFGLNTFVFYLTTGSPIPDETTWVADFATELQWLITGWCGTAAVTLWIAHREGP